MFGKQAFTFVDGVDPQKNILCGGTQFISQPKLLALLKIKITGNGLNCEIEGRSSDRAGADPGSFVKFVIANVLEIIALKIN